MKQLYYTLLLLLLISFTHVAQAQITLTEQYFLQRIGMTETTTLFELDDSMDMTGIINATGADQTWDFSGFMITDTFTVSQTYFQLPADVPGAALFPDSDFAIELTSDTIDAELGEEAAFYLYSSLSDGFFKSNGSVSFGDLDEDGEVDTLLFAFSPPSMENPVPLTYEATWDDSTASVLTFAGFSFPASSAELSTSTVDGYGTLITPEGSYEALRITTDFYTRDLASGIVTMTHTDVEFITAEGASASIFIDEDGADASFAISDIMMSGTSAEDEEGLPTDFQLSQNYPNPFNPSTMINYTLSAPSDVTLKVYTLTGQEVATLVNATQGVGRYEVQFDASSLASGLYLYRLETGSFSETRMMSLIR